MRRLATGVGATIFVILAAGVAGSVEPRAYSASHFALELDGHTTVGFLRSVDGGSIKAEVITYQEGTSAYGFKQIGRPKYEDISFQVGMGMSPAFYEWVGGMFDGNPTRKDGAVLTAGSDFKAMSKREFRDALITEVGFPALDASSKDPAYMTVKISPESLQYEVGDGSVITGQPALEKQKQWSASNFRFSLGDLPCSRVTKIDAFSIKQKVVEVASGQEREPVRVPGKLEFPNLVVTIPPVDSKAWIDWHQQFVVGGRNGQGDELDGSLSFLDPKGVELARIDLSHVGVFGLSLLTPGPDDKTAGPGAFHPVVVHLYVEAMKFTHLAGGTK